MRIINTCVGRVNISPNRFWVVSACVHYQFLVVGYKIVRTGEGAFRSLLYRLSSTLPLKEENGRVNLGIDY